MKYTKYILSIVIPFGLLYLAFSLFNWSLNCYEWNHQSIIFYSIFSGVFTTYLIIHNIALDASKIDVNDIWVYGAKIVKK